MADGKELKEYTQLRSNIKARITIFQKYIDIVKLVEPKTLAKLQINELQLKLSRLQELFSSFDDIQNKIELLTSDNISPQLEERDTIESSFCKSIAIAQDILESACKSDRPPSQGSDNSIKTNNEYSMCNIRLPTIKLPSFDGNNLKWLEYRDTFESLIHNNDSIPKINKFHYLRSSLEGSARKESHKSLRYMVDYYTKNLRSLEELKEPVQFWDTLVIYIMTSKLDPATGRKWEEHRNSLDLSPTLADFFEFLRSRANILETIQHGRTDSIKLEKHNTYKENKPTRSFVTSSVATNKRKCVVCNSNHLLYECEQFKNMSMDSKTTTISKYKLCKNCLRPGHHHSRCRLSACKICNRKHNSLLHRNENTNKNNLPAESTTSSSFLPRESQVSLSASVSGQVLLCTAEIEVVDTINNKTHLVKALLDSGSQSSFVSEKIKNKINILCRKTNIPILGVNNCITNSVECCNLLLKSCVNSFQVKVDCLVIPHITNKLPSVLVDVAKLNMPSNIQLADTKFFCPSEIDLLLGADIYWDLIMPNQIKLGKNNPTLQESKFGWLVAGPTGGNPYSSTPKVHCHFTKEIKESLAKFWEVEELQSNTKILSKEEEYCENHFIQYTKRLPSGRFSVTIPFREPPENVLGESHSIARKRFYNLEKRLARNGHKIDYSNFIQEYESLGHLSQIERPKFGYFIPHHAVIRENSETTRLRVVFNASFKTDTGKSLNDLMMIGPVVQDDLLSILLRFRYNKYVVTADITKMYRQIEIDHSQRHLQLILWRDNDRIPLKTLQLNTVTYGTAAASFLSTRCLLQLAEECTDPVVADVIKHDFYVDDLITGSSSKSILAKSVQAVVQKLNEGCFSLHKFRSNVPDLLKEITPIDQTQDFCKESSILGLKWQPSTDKLKFYTQLNIDTNVTKRTILSTSCKVFDPLGLLSACTIIPKILLQKLWLSKLEWDEPVPDVIKEKCPQTLHFIVLLTRHKHHTVLAYI
ncbi:uncharacterized protein LOC131851942 [Achroia grisella]|uniref:uncharacterized protein LOC131851942 n=1 Tax=Achroia grisella TaxID=688607 RepID=UPI0027D318CC|nr:uncharacterized protein LOC131851942 [Achroia grisella]